VGERTVAKSLLSQGNTERLRYSSFKQADVMWASKTAWTLRQRRLHEAEFLLRTWRVNKSSPWYPALRQINLDYILIFYFCKNGSKVILPFKMRSQTWSSVKTF
jgi:hypothetical protein